MVQFQVRQQPADHQLPEPGNWKIERRRPAGLQEMIARDEGNRSDGQDRDEEIPVSSVEQNREQRPEDIKLFFDRQTPEMEQRLAFRRGVEVADLSPKQDVFQEEGACENMLTQLPEFVIEQD